MQTLPLESAHYVRRTDPMPTRRKRRNSMVLFEFEGSGTYKFPISGQENSGSYGSISAVTDTHFLTKRPLQLKTYSYKATVPYSDMIKLPRFNDYLLTLHNNKFDVLCYLYKNNLTFIHNPGSSEQYILTVEESSEDFLQIKALIKDYSTQPSPSETTRASFFEELSVLTTRCCNPLPFKAIQLDQAEREEFFFQYVNDKQARLYFHDDPTNTRLILERIEGETLFQNYANGKASYLQCLQDYHDILKILKELHEEKKCIHGDFNPSNIIRSPSGELILIDFAHAAFLDTEKSLLGFRNKGWNHTYAIDNEFALPFSPDRRTHDGFIQASKQHDIYSVLYYFHLSRTEYVKDKSSWQMEEPLLFSDIAELEALYAGFQIDDLIAIFDEAIQNRQDIIQRESERQPLSYSELIATARARWPVPTPPLTMEDLSLRQAGDETQGPSILIGPGPNRKSAFTHCG